MEFFLISTLNGLAYGLLLFMLSSGLTLTFSMMGVLNFAHASFYMLGAYFAYSLTPYLGFWLALVAAPVGVGLLGALTERLGLRSLHRLGHIPELLLTYGLAYVVVEFVQLGWGRSPLPTAVPQQLEGSLFTLYSTTFPMFRAFTMLVALGMLAAIYLVLTRSRVGLVIQAALTHPQMVEALGHNVPLVFMLVFGGGCALAGMAGVLGGITFVTEPSMAQMLGAMLFVVVVIGGLGSLAGAFVASILVGLIQSFAVGLDYSIASTLSHLGIALGESSPGWPVWRLTLAQVAPMLPYVLMVLILVLRPRGLMGAREG